MTDAHITRLHAVQLGLLVRARELNSVISRPSNEQALQIEHSVMALRKAADLLDEIEQEMAEQLQVQRNLTGAGFERAFPMVIAKSTRRFTHRRGWIERFVEVFHA